MTVKLGVRECLDLSAALPLFDATFEDPDDATITGIPDEAMFARVQAVGGTVRYRDDVKAGVVFGISAGASTKVRITSPRHGLVTGDQVTVQGVPVVTEANVAANAVTVIDADTFDLDGTTLSNTYLSGAPTAVANNGSGAVRITDAAHGLTDGDLVFIQGNDGYNGTWRVDVISSSVFDLVGSKYVDASRWFGTWKEVSGRWHQTDHLPTASEGMRLADGDSLSIGHPDSLLRYAFIQEVSADLVVTYSRN